MNRMVKLFGLLVFSDVLNAEYVVAQLASDEDLARAALRSVFGPGNQEALRARIQRSTESIVSDKGVMQGLAEEPVAATVIFKQGYTANEVEVFTDTGRAGYTLELTRTTQQPRGVNTLEEFFTRPDYYSAPRQIVLGASVEF